MRYLYSVIFLLLVNIAFAQPSNDDCSGVIDLGIAPVCPETIYDNVNATPTDVGNDNEPGCFLNNPPSNDVWFQFVTDALIVDYTVIITGTDDGPNDALDNIQFAIYRGFCSEDNLFLNSCQFGSVGQQLVELDLVNLTPNELYYIRIDNYGDNNAEGDFKVCVEEKSPDVNIDEGSSNDCEGILYDSGGPDENYENNEDFTFVICPEVFHQCITFNMEYYNIEGGFDGDNMQFFNGPDINSPIIAELNGSGFPSDVGGGGVCYTVKADSCLTIRFTSGSNINQEGFMANWICSTAPCIDDEVLVINEGATFEEIENAISTPLAQVTVTDVICDEGAYATFADANKTDLGMTGGLLLTCGSPLNAVGPNTQTGAGTIAGTPGDDDLDVLSDLYDDGSLSNDACIVEVDVTVYTEELNFEYIFGSEEYPEFVNSFNDIFALLISGPGISGIAGLNGQDNMAIIPGTDLPISINTVNNISNWEYYRSNFAGQSLQYDGLTSGFLGNKKTLTASATVQPCSTYSLKFAIADRGDSSFDSGVFISEIKSGLPEITAKFSSGLDYFVEKCIGESVDTIVLSLSEAVDEEQVYTVVVSGTAIDPDDYELQIPDTIVFGPGQIEQNFPIQVFDDDLMEGDETVVITLFRNFGCGDVQVVETTIFIRENIQVEIDTDQDSIFICGGIPIQVEANGANNYSWTPFNIFDDPFISNPVVEGGYTGWIFVEGKIDPFTSPECIGYDSIYIRSVNPIVEITTDDPKTMCVGDTITVTALTDSEEYSLEWQYDFGQVESQGETTTDVVPPFGFNGFPQVITVTIEEEGCIAMDTIQIIVDPFTVVTPLFTDTVLCQDGSIDLNEDGFSFNGTTFDWTPTTYLDDPSTAFTFSSPEDDIDYELIVTSPSGACADTFNYSIELLPNEITITQGEEVRICLGDSINLSAIFEPATADVIWIPSQFVTTNNGGETIAFPNVTTDFTVISTNGVCTAQDVIRVIVDSLPNMEIEAIPVRDPYCEGDIITFISPGYKGYKFPLIEHFWSPGTGVFTDQSDLTDYNIVLGAVETTTYIRTTNNGACSTMDTFAIRVVDPELEISLNDTTICSGEDLELSFMANGELDDIVWDSNSGTFTCDDCPEPTLENIENSTSVNLEGAIEGCPVEASMEVTAISYGGYVEAIPDSSCYFYGDIITLTAVISPDPGLDFSLGWNGEGVPEGSTGNPIIVPLPGNDGSTGEKTLNYSFDVTDAMGCTGSGGVDICIKNRFDIPDAFSPNGDGVNDVFRLVDFGAGLNNIEIDRFSVFNRWGQKVFDCDEYDCATDTGWDGEFNKVTQPGGTYVYYVTLLYADGNIEEFKGDLLLIR